MREFVRAQATVVVGVELVELLRQARDVRRLGLVDDAVAVGIEPLARASVEVDGDDACCAGAGG